MEDRVLALPGGRRLVIRAMRRTDAPGIGQLYARLSEDDLYKRFFSGRPPPEAFIEKMASAAEDEGFGVVAMLAAPGATERMVGEASFSPLPDGNAEVGITVDPAARGWLGPYLLDVLVGEAGHRGIPNLEAEVLATNRQMQALLESRRSAVMEHSDCPAIVRLCIGTTGRSAAWTGPHDRPRVLVEVAGGRWRAAEAAREAGFQVLACPGVHRRLTRCPALGGRPCPLAATADVIVDAVRDEAGRQLLEAHHELHPAVPVCVDTGARQGPAPEPGGGEAGRDEPMLFADMDDVAVVGVLQRLASVHATD